MDTKKVNETLSKTDGDGATATNFVRAIVEDDLKSGRREGVVVRFPPEPNGYPHIGHAKSICLNFGLAADYDGVCHLRFDDTNPETEDIEYVNAIKRDIRWLGFDWGDKEFYASDYFEQLYEWAVELIKKGKAYVDDSSEKDIRAYRGSVTEPGRESPYRNRSVEENLDLFERMKNGEFPNGSRVLRARIDMAHPNMKMRDPLMYRIRHASHYRRGDAWCIYPFYDWAHGQSDAIENITHSICTLEFEVNRPLYDWYIEALGIDPRPRQYEFARLNVNYTITSKRKLLQLVKEGHVSGWDDPRMPTLSGLRRRGVTPEAIRTFCDRVGVTKVDSVIDIGLLEYSIRDDLNYKAPRVMCVLRPLKVTITNYPDAETEWLDAPYWPHDVPLEGSRKVPFSRTLFIERDDFMEDPPKRFHRLSPGREVRLRYGYIIKCEEVVKDENGEVVELRCTYDPETKSGGANADRKVKGTIHWVSAGHALTAEVRLYDRLFSAENPSEGVEDFKENLNPESMVVLKDSRIEPSVADDPADMRYQFTRLGYFWRDPEDSSPEALVFNRIVALRDTWAKIKTKKDGAKANGAAKKAKPAPEASGPPKAKQDPTKDLTDRQRARLAKYKETLSLSQKDALQLVGNPAVASYFEEAVAAHDNPKALANWIIHSLLPARKGTPMTALKVTPAGLAALVALIDDGTVSTRIAREVFAEMMQNGGDPKAIAEQKSQAVLADPETLAPIIDKLLADYPDKVDAYKGGKTGLLGFFVGQVMRATGGKAKPQLVKEMVEAKLG